MNTIIKAASAKDFLGLIPSLIGYTPTESVVVVPFSGSRTMGAMRFDLPGPDHIRDAATTMAGILCKLETADGAVVIVYTDEAAIETELILEVLEHRLTACGLKVIDLLYVAVDGYGSAKAGTGPHPVSEILPHPDAPSFTVGDQRTGAELPAVAEWFASRTLTTIGSIDEENLTPEHLLALGKALAKTTMQEHELAWLHWLLERPALRDILLLTVTGGRKLGEAGLDAQLSWEEGVEYPAELAQVMWGAGDRPKPERLQMALSNVRTLLAIVPQPGAYATAAWLAWALGRSTEAEIYAKAGLAQDPSHGLCEIVQSFVTAGHLPDWAFTPKENQ